MLHTLLEDPRVFAFTQKLNPMTVSLYRRLVTTYVSAGPGAAVLDIGCGVGAHRPLFPDARYVGIDVNAEYIRVASARPGTFLVMDAGALDFPEGSFDTAFTVATCHHLDDGRILSMVRNVLQVLRPGGTFHIIDPVLPVSPRAALKAALFRRDRGRFQRTVPELTGLLARGGRVARVDVRSGVLHDVAYVGLSGADDRPPMGRD